MHSICKRPIVDIFSRVRCVYLGVLSQRHSSTASPSTSVQVGKLVPLRSIPKEDLGSSILHLKENSGYETPHDHLTKGIKISKYISWGSTAVGAILIPYMTSKLAGSTEDTRLVLFVATMDLFVAISMFTPLLLHFLSKRCPLNVYFNKQTQTFTTIHYNYFLQKRALRFRPEDVIDIQSDLSNKKLLASLATILVHNRPILLPLNREAYRDQEAFDLLTRNVKIPEGHD